MTESRRRGGRLKDMPRKGDEIRIRDPDTFDTGAIRDAVLWCLCAGLCLVVFALDISVTAGISIGILYVPIIVVAYGIRRADAPAIVATVGTILVGLGYILAGPILTPLQAVVARGLSLFIIWAAVFLPFLGAPARRQTGPAQRGTAVETPIDFGQIRGISHAQTAMPAHVEGHPDMAVPPVNPAESAVRDILATILSLVEKAHRDRPHSADYVALVKSYIDAFERIHLMLIEGGWGGVFMHSLVSAVTDIHGPGEGSPFQRHGENIWLAPRPGVALGMVLTELARHAASDGALTAADGHVVIVWRTEGENAEATLILDWREEGGETFRALTAGGLYTDIIREMALRELNGDMAFGLHENSLQCTLRMPLSPLLGAGPPPGSGADAPVCRGQSTNAADLAGRRILIIEDQAVIAAGTRACLEAAGLAVVGMAEDTENALKALMRTDPEAVILDADLDAESTGSIAKSLADRRIPFILTSGYDPDPTLVRRYPGVPYLRKPVTAGEMTSALKTAMTHPPGPTYAGPRAVS